MRYFLGLTAALAMMVAAAAGATTPSQPTAKKKTVSTKKSAVRRPSATAHPGASPVRRQTTTAANRKKTAPAAHAVTWRNRQLAPTSDRYREIQEALSAKGYLQPDRAGGVWNQESTDALKKFQAEQNIDASGKINSLSLIALGLGPKHDALPQQLAAAPPEQVNR